MRNSKSWLQCRVVQALVAQVSDLTNQFQQLKIDSAHAPTVPNPPPAIPPADHSTRQLPILVSLNYAIFFWPNVHCFLLSSFPTEESKVAFVITLLSGQAAHWGTAVWEQGHQCCSSFQSFNDKLKMVFDGAVSGREAKFQKLDLRVGITHCIRRLD